jgi:PAP2 superfamily
MSSDTLSDLKMPKHLTLQAFKQWAFPHWAMWLAVLALLAANSIWLLANPRISIEALYASNNAVAVTIAIIAIAFRVMRFESFDWFLHRVWAVLLYVLLAAVLMINLQIISHLMMTIDFPMADERLLAWDKAIGFDWLAYAKLITSLPLLTNIVFFAYNELTFAGLAIIAAMLIILNLRVRALEIMFLIVATAFICILLSSAFAAKGTLALMVDPELASRLNLGNLSSQAEIIAELRSTNPIHMAIANLEGIVSFPSFHTCMALIAAWCCRGRWYTFTLGVANAAAILIATPIFGGHYLVDLIGGLIVTISGIIVWNKLVLPNLATSITQGADQKLPLPHWMQAALPK